MKRDLTGAWRRSWGAARRDVAARAVASDRWQARPVLAFFLRLSATAVPIAVSLLVAVVVARSLPLPEGWLQTAGWWVAVVLSSTVALIATDRVARRLLPLAVLLDLSLIFPDKAPSRLVLLRGTGSSRDVARKVAEARARGRDDAPVRAAETLVTLVGVLGLHDRRTRGHSERVRVYTDMISDELGLSDEDRGKLRWAALLHDFGKLSVPPAVLNKNGKPDPSEWDLIYRHPDEGMRLAEGLTPWLGQWASAIGQHHEKFDGTGYPRGLSGHEIGLGARIVAVADAYEVMTAPRSYKRPMTAAAAREELTRCAGTHFDPAVVRAFLNVSLGRMRWYLAPLSWLTQGPVVAVFEKARYAAGQAASVGTAAVVAGGVVAGGAAAPIPGQADEASAAAAQAAGPWRVDSPLVTMGPPIVLSSGASTFASPSAIPRNRPLTLATAGAAGTATPSPATRATPVRRSPVGSDRPGVAVRPGPSTSAGPTGGAAPVPASGAATTPAAAAEIQRLYLGSSSAGSAYTYRLASSAPAASGVPDVDGDGRPGLTVTASRTLLADPDPANRPAWISRGAAQRLDGPASITFSSQLLSDPGPGTVRAYLQDCTAGGSCTTLASGRVHDGRWSPDGWEAHTISFGSVTHTLPAGHELRVVLVVDDRGSRGDIAVAVGSADHPAVLRLTTG